MNLGERAIICAIDFSLEENKVKEVYDIIKPFINNPLKLDIMTICRVEHLLGRKILILFPTLKQLRKIKLARLNEIKSGVEVIYSADCVKEFYNNFFKNNI